MKKVVWIILITLSSIFPKYGVDDEVTLNFHNDLKKIEFNRDEIDLINYLIAEFSTDYLDSKYDIDTLDVKKHSKHLGEVLNRSRYFQSRSFEGNEDFILSYTTFRNEYEYLKGRFTDFDYSDFKRESQFLDIKSKLRKRKISPSKVDKLLSSIDSLDFSPIHFYYRPNSIKEQIKRDITKVAKIDMKPVISFSKRYKPTLKAAQKQFGVNWEIIVAILKKETNLGRYPLRNKPFEVLIPQMLFGINNPYEDQNSRGEQYKRIERLQDSAKKSLIHLIEYSLKNDIDPDSIKSNRVGAIGIPQFMPFNLYLAKDGDGDGKASLSNIEDTIFSVANFLKRNGWKKVYNYKKDKKTIIKKVKRYNLSSSYAKGVYDIAVDINKKIK